MSDTTAQPSQQSKSAGQSRDSFPMTQRGWLVAQLAQGPTGLSRINGYIMQTYAEPLGNYVAGSTFRSLSTSADLVAGFFASRLAQLRATKGSDDDETLGAIHEQGRLLWN